MFNMRTKILFGKNCINDNKSLFNSFGRNAFIVTGKSSGNLSGALDTVIEVLKKSGISYMVYDSISNNPSLENVKEAGDAAKKYKADIVIGIGGGSPLDASKAVAVLAVNDIEPIELFKNEFPKKPLPIIAVPTTAGTGSEVTPYSILTRNDIKTKMSFGNEDTFPKVAFIDATYTESLSWEVTVNTAIDALSHAMEGYLSRRSTPVSDVIAVEAIHIFGQCMQNLLNNRMNYETREKLIYMSMLGGMVIAHTGTTIIHGLGYSMTYFKDVPHGKANGFLMKEYLKYNYGCVDQKIDNVLKLLNIDSINDFGEIIAKLLPESIELLEEELNQYAELAMKQKSTTYNARSVVKEDLVDILRNSFI